MEITDYNSEFKYLYVQPPFEYNVGLLEALSIRFASYDYIMELINFYNNSLFLLIILPSPLRQDLMPSNNITIKLLVNGNIFICI